MHSDATSKALLQDAQDRYRDALVTIAKLESQLESLTLRLALKADLASEANSREAELKETVGMLRHQLKDAEEMILVERTQAMDKVKAVIAELERENLGSMAKHVQSMIERSTKGVLDELQNRVAQVVAGQQHGGGVPAPATPGVPSAGGRLDRNHQNTPIHVHVHHNGHTVVEEEAPTATAAEETHATGAAAASRRNPPARPYQPIHHDYRDAQNPAVASSMRSMPILSSSPHAHTRSSVFSTAGVASSGYAIPVSSHRLVRLVSPKKPAPSAASDASAVRGNIRDTIAKLKQQNAALVSKLDSLARRNELYGVAHRR
ncbi:hypothetical protein BCR44DRAFT_1428101 [Catenaria anguillulae PL171]|uniref:Uncharacterized protein n=1 Tax=Catenaria anguillulae PL171 TaxID=765915 RepID=A0A1Y2HWP2_9FUNG|nr:hypothetical protein BCR44DRAFT_1428101 [Catenaria anguillulae PL171]